MFGRGLIKITRYSLLIDAVMRNSKSSRFTRQIAGMPPKRSRAKKVLSAEAQPEKIKVSSSKTVSKEAEEVISESEDTIQSEPEKIPDKKPVRKNKRKTPEEDKLEEEDTEDVEDIKETSKKNQTATRKNKRAANGASEPPTKKAKTEPKQMMNKVDTNLDDIDFSCNNLNENGQEFNLKISSWNVSGIRAVIKKSGIEYIIKEDADIVALQETKCDKDKLPNEVKLDGYHCYFLDSKKSGYCGMALYSKKEPIDVNYGLKGSEVNDEGRMITAEYENFYLVNVYVPNAGPKLVTLPKRLKWNDQFKSYIKELDAKKPVIICGDMNVAHQEIDLTNPKTNTKNAGFTKEEREGMTDFLKQGFVDTFRALYPNQEGAYTFWSYFANARNKNIGWRLDYYLVSERIMNSVCDNVIRNQVYGSDHCPIVLFINT